ncbi:MAG: FAD-binding oxidoreductase [Aquisalinus sp.]|nr:FAD-binding oxidoreductase [Aquisalinus sp.]
MLLCSPSAMNRRTFLKISAASAALVGCSPNPPKRKKHIAVIGGGIIGSSIAYHLTKGGAQVSLLERNRLAELASRGTFAWINATWAKQPRHYHEFNQAGVQSWKHLQSELDIPVRWGGSLEWFTSVERQRILQAQISEQIEWGEPATMITGDTLSELEPNVVFGNVDSVAYSPNDGAVDPVLATRKMVAAAQKEGASIRENCAVETVSTLANGQVQLNTSCGPLIVDDYVLATGADAAATISLADIKIPQRTTPGIIVITQPMPRLINRIIVAPGVHIHQRDDGRIVLGEQDGAPDNTAHQMRLSHRPTSFPDPAFAEQHASRILMTAEAFVPGMASADIEDVYIGWRPLPLDGHPVLGRSPNQPRAYLAIMHSGVSLAPAVGELVAKEILYNASAATLDEYRPDRNFEEIRRY